MRLDPANDTRPQPLPALPTGGRGSFIGRAAGSFCSEVRDLLRLDLADEAPEEDAAFRGLLWDLCSCNHAVKVKDAANETEPPKAGQGRGCSKDFQAYRLNGVVKTVPAFSKTFVAACPPGAGCSSVVSRVPPCSGNWSNTRTA